MADFPSAWRDAAAFAAQVFMCPVADEDVSPETTSPTTVAQPSHHASGLSTPSDCILDIALRQDIGGAYDLMAETSALTAAEVHSTDASLKAIWAASIGNLLEQIRFRRLCLSCDEQVFNSG